jgi:glutathione synthase/RimK-type ligase-like ATP-grasp enzyme
MKNSQRPFVKVIKEICKELDITCDTFSYDWIFRLEKDGRVAFIYGYKFGINSSASELICTDKSAASGLLQFAGVPAVEHHFFMAPWNMKYLGEEGNWPQLKELLERYGRLVCKNNQGTGGNEVYLVVDTYQLERTVHKLFKHVRSISVSPFYPIEHEYRVIVLHGQVKLVYTKLIPFVIGDGQTSLYDLVITYLKEHPDSPLQKKLQLEEENFIPEKGQRISLHWKHNLGQGSRPEVVADETLKQELSTLALKAAQAVKIDFASVDIIRTGGNLMVLEINSGMMMDNFMGIDQAHYRIGKDIYKEAVQIMFSDY